MAAIVSGNYRNLVAAEDAQVEFAHKKPYGGLRLYGVACAIERRSESRNAEQAGHNAHHTAAHTGLGGDSGGIQPVAGVLVEAHRGHHGGYLCRYDGIEHLLRRNGIQPLVGDGAPITASCAEVMPSEHWRV